MWVDGFWVGAARIARRVPLAARVEAAGGWAAVRTAGPAGWGELGLSPPEVHRWASASALRTAGLAVTMDDPRYPRALRELPDAPPLLFVEGDPEALQQRAVAVVGTLGATGYGRQVARALGQRLGDAGWCVVSGLARGIDGEAHRGALETGRTIAVLAHGLGHTSPSSHRELRRRIVESGGAVLTTWPDGQPAKRWTFPVRNRWIAGLARAVVVVEAGLGSGALHTVRAALDCGREVFAVPGPIGSKVSEGCNRLIADGASPVVGIADLLRSLGSAQPPPTWIDRLVAGEDLVDVARSRGLTVEELLAELAMLEATGELVRLPGARYARRR